MGFFGIFGCNNNKSEDLNSSNTKEEKTVTQNIYGEESTFSFEDFEDLKNNDAYDPFTIGELNVTSGKIVCADPMYREFGNPQSWKVPPGNYPVNIYIGLKGEFNGRVAYSELVFSKEAVESWEYSLIEEETLTDEFEKKMNGMYPVENGLSSFCDYSSWEKYKKVITDFYSEDSDANFYNDILDTLFKANSGIPASSRGEDWVNFKINSSENIIMFGTGWGDGMYPRYVGYDKKGNPVKMITDFIQINPEEPE